MFSYLSLNMCKCTQPGEVARIVNSWSTVRSSLKNLVLPSIYLLYPLKIKKLQKSVCRCVMVSKSTFETTSLWVLCSKFGLLEQIWYIYVALGRLRNYEVHTKLTTNANDSIQFMYVGAYHRVTANELVLLAIKIDPC